MKCFIFMVFMLLAGAVPGAAFAQGISTQTSAPVLPTLGIAPGDAAPLRAENKGESVLSVDGLLLRLDDGQTVELPGIWLPQGQGFEPSDQLIQAKDLMDKIFDSPADRKIILYQTPSSGRGRVNRLGHELAHVVRKNGNVWIQGALVANGLAQVWPTVANPELATKMYALEDGARKAGLGLWAAGSPWHMLRADGNFSRFDRFAVVEGVVRNEALVNNVLYLNFGQDFRKDFSIGITSRVRRQLLQNHVDPMKLQGQSVRVRGWLRYYNGPYIELADAVQLQTLDQPQQDYTVPGSPQLRIVPRKPASAPIVHGMVMVPMGTEVVQPPKQEPAPGQAAHAP